MVKRVDPALPKDPALRAYFIEKMKKVRLRDDVEKMNSHEQLGYLMVLSRLMWKVEPAPPNMAAACFIGLVIEYGSSFVNVATRWDIDHELFIEDTIDLLKRVARNMEVLARKHDMHADALKRTEGFITSIDSPSGRWLLHQIVGAYVDVGRETRGYKDPPLGFGTRFQAWEDDDE